MESLVKTLLSIPEFCRLAGISTPTYYKMRAEGRGPREIRLVGAVVRISTEAMREWQAARENPDEAEAAATTAQAAKLKARSRYATSGGRG